MMDIIPIIMICDVIICIYSLETLFCRPYLNTFWHFHEIFLSLTFFVRILYIKENWGAIIIHHTMLQIVPPKVHVLKGKQLTRLFPQIIRAQQQQTTHDHVIDEQYTVVIDSTILVHEQLYECGVPTDFSSLICARARASTRRSTY